MSVRRVPGVPAVVGVSSLQFAHFCNSGAAALSLAVWRGAQRITMLGYDCQRTGGKAHWHGNHHRKLRNAYGLAQWPAMFADVARSLRDADVQVINATRETALTCFARQPLETALETALEA